MALPPSVRAGQSNVPTQFQNQGYNRGFQGNIIGGPNPDTIINYQIDGQTRTPNFTFPTDLPKYHFTIIQNDWGEVSRNLKFEAMYKLPLPMALNAEHEVNYETNFNYLSILASIGQRLFGSPGAAAAGLAKGGAAALGLTLNTFKTVTMSVPDFRTFQLGWKFSPKNFPEAQTIQRIIFALKKAMHPKTATQFGVQADKLVLRFPKIFTMYFNPNIRYLYKFKPAVLSSIKVDYNGGQPVPSFYKSPNAPSESPPESISVIMNFLELEYWLDTDFKMLNGLPTNDPFDAFNFYQYGEEPHTPIIPPGR